jgi:hypothetical protein
MEVTIQVDPEKEPELYDRLRGASETLEEIVGPRAARFVTAVEWSPFKDSGPFGPRQAVRLKMTDRLSGTVEELFQPVELRSPDYLKTRLREVWGRFLRQLSHEQMDRIDQLASTLERD